MQKEKPSVSPCGKIKTSLLIGGGVILSTFSGDTAPTKPTQPRQEQTQALDTQRMCIDQARECVRRNVHRCIQECGVVDGLAVLRKCWNEKQIDGPFMAMLDAALSEHVAHRVRSIAKVLAVYPELAPEIPVMAREHLRSLPYVDPKRAALWFLDGELELLNNKEHMQESSETYVRIIESRAKTRRRSLLTDAY